MVNIVSLSAKFLENRHDTASDVTFILDASRSASFMFSALKGFLLKIMSRFTLSSQFGLISVGDSASYTIAHGDITSLEDFKAELNRVALIGGDRANIEASLKETLRMLEGQNSGLRKGIPKVFVLLTTSNVKASGRETELIQKIHALGMYFWSFNIYYLPF